jgi:drug/metabolite transporter (DMT)-like permease
MASRTGASFMLVVVMVIWGASVPVSKAAVAEVPPLLLAWLRFAITALLLWPAYRSRRRAGASAIALRPALGLGLTGIALYYLGYNVGLMYTSATHAALIMSATPALTLVLAAVWLHERFTPVTIAGVVLSVAGVLLIVTGRTAGAHAPDPLLGNALIIAAVGAWAVYTILAKRSAHLDPLVVTVATSVAGVALLTPAVVVEFALGARMALTATGFAAVVYLGVVASALGYAMYSASLRVLGAAQASTYLNLLPVVGVASAMVMLGERIDTRTLVGGVAVLAGVALATMAPPARA